MSLTPTPLYCSECGCQQIEAPKSYTVKAGGVRRLYYQPRLQGSRASVTVLLTVSSLSFMHAAQLKQKLTYGSLIVSVETPICCSDGGFA
jgi:hypothetical protein